MNARTWRIGMDIFGHWIFRMFLHVDLDIIPIFFNITQPRRFINIFFLFSFSKRLSNIISRFLNDLFDIQAFWVPPALHLRSARDFYAFPP